VDCHDIRAGARTRVGRREASSGHRAVAGSAGFLRRPTLPRVTRAWGATWRGVAGAWASGRGGGPRYRCHRGVPPRAPETGGHSHHRWENTARGWHVPGVYQTRRPQERGAASRSGAATIGWTGGVSETTPGTSAKGRAQPGSGAEKSEGAGYEVQPWAPVVEAGQLPRVGVD